MQKLPQYAMPNEQRYLCHTHQEVTWDIHRMVMCLDISPPLPVTPPSRAPADAVPAFFSKIFQNFRLSSAAVHRVSQYG